MVLLFFSKGPHIEWLACALYIACRSSVTKTVEGEEYTGNSISLTQILRATKLRLACWKYFVKMSVFQIFFVFLMFALLTMLTFNLG